MTEDDPNPPEKGRQYRYDDGTVEVVFTTEEGRVLSVREYPNIETFRETVESASEAGIHESIAALPGIEAFAEKTDSPDDESDPTSPDDTS